MIVSKKNRISKGFTLCTLLKPIMIRKCKKLITQYIQLFIKVTILSAHYVRARTVHLTRNRVITTCLIRRFIEGLPLEEESSLHHNLLTLYTLYRV